MGIQRGGCNNHLELRPFWEEETQESEYKVYIQASFMGLVNDKRVVFIQLGIALGLCQEHTVGKYLYIGITRGPVLETDLIAHGFAKLFTQFFSDPA